MAALYIKDPETAAAVARVAHRLGKTKTEVVREAIAKMDTEVSTVSAEGLNWLEWIKQRRKSHPLPPPTGLKADKAFYDKMWGEVPD